MAINPGHAAVLSKEKNITLPLFDRSVHPHVIECLYCHICRVNVSPRTRHCSVCNKCIDGYDHHCFFLNNCVGSRNFRWFFANVVTAIIGLLLIVALALLEFVAYFTDKSTRVILQPYVSMSSGMAAQFKVFYYPARDEGWLALVGATAVLGSVTCALLILLFISHCYVNHHRLAINSLAIRQGLERFSSRLRNARSYCNIGWRKSRAVGANAQGASILPLHVVESSNGDNIELPYDNIRSTADEF
ncbi:hypothetical protein ACJMK2_025280 [Sinanodonta woodiana]|uniref:Palmitoyltransferase n=1 Tax=Sinanodonta woodiana TaxID=1069815 RepID=A0ABD3XFZ5_SINWO